MPYNNLSVQSPLMPGMWVSPGGNVDGSAVVPNSGGKTVDQIVAEWSNPTPSMVQNAAKNTFEQMKAGNPMTRDEFAYKDNWLSNIIHDAHDKYMEYKENQPNDDPTPTPPSAKEYYGNPANPVIDYLNADIAKHYGMSKETAYQESLANTSYQRAVKDMQMAGLNPAAIFGAGRGSGSNGVSYVSDNSARSIGRLPDEDSTKDGFLTDPALMESIGAVIAVSLGANATLGKSAGKAVAIIAQKLDGLSVK